ncbi:MAG: imidazole glycerol phosphate synthase subunit HisH [Actinobacteria bacterium]|nr:MAG: imidazole glycerol phosphate synthase subunit HisH [Actinomycetota bacterium]
MTRVAVLDFGMGNLRSVAKALERVGATVDVTADVPPEADALVVPGQGAFASCLVNLGPAGRDAIAAWIASGRTYLGICLGLQVLFESSQEGGGPGLGIFEGKVVRFPDGVKIPHIGWNEVTPVRASPLFAGIEPGTRFYFCHSYFPDAAPDVVTATSDHGATFACAASRGNVHAVQFHPEKSGDPGLSLLENFVRAVGAS